MDDLDILLAQRKRRQSVPDPVLRRLLRERAGLTQADVARLLGVRRPSVTRYENGERTPRGPQLDAYLQLLDRLAQA